MSDPRFTFLRSVTADDEQVLGELISGTTIRIALSRDVSKTFAGQVLTYQLATLTARLSTASRFVVKTPTFATRV